MFVPPYDDEKFPDPAPGVVGLLGLCKKLTLLAYIRGKEVNIS